MWKQQLKQTDEIRVNRIYRWVLERAARLPELDLRKFTNERFELIRTFNWQEIVITYNHSTDTFHKPLNLLYLKSDIVK